jgi:hypothetical protein
MSVIDVFPTRPLRLTGYYERLSYWSLILTCVGIAAIAFEVYSVTPALLDDYRLHTDGMLAHQSHLKNGSCEMKIVDMCEFDALYKTADGSSHTQHIELLTILQKPDQHFAFTVRYDAASPRHISTTWGARLLANRTISLLVGLAFALGGIVYLAWLAMNPRRIRRKLATIGARPIPVAVNFVRVSTPPNSKSANIFYSWIDASGRSLTASTEFRGTRDPFWLDTAKTKMLALTSPDGQAHLLDAALASVSLSNAERVRVIEARDRLLVSVAS